MPQATETLRLSIAGAIGRRAAKSQCSATRRRSPAPSAPSARTRLRSCGTSSSVAVGVAVQRHAPVAERRQLVEGAGEVDHLDHRHHVESARGRAGGHAAELGAAARRQHHRADLEGGGRAQDRADIVRIGHLIEQQHEIAAGLGRAGPLELEPRQRRGRERQPLMHRAPRRRGARSPRARRSGSRGRDGGRPPRGRPAPRRSPAADGSCGAGWRAPPRRHGDRRARVLAACPCLAAARSGAAAPLPMAVRAAAPRGRAGTRSRRLAGLVGPRSRFIGGPLRTARGARRGCRLTKDLQ